MTFEARKQAPAEARGAAFESAQGRRPRHGLGPGAKPLFKVLAGLSALGLLPAFGFWLWAIFAPLPTTLLSGPPEPGLLVQDRNGQTIREVSAPDQKRALTVMLSEVSPDLVSALLAAEDARFYWHPGIDPAAISRALWQRVRFGRVISGGSTITQQLARSTFARPPGIWGKVAEARLALRIEHELDKSRILEEYLNRIDFGPNVRGVAAASRLFFDKSPKSLSLGEAAALAAIPRGPSVYDPRRYPKRVKERRDRILRQMQERGFAEPSRVRVALSERLTLHAPYDHGGAAHLIRALASGRLEPDLRQRGSLVRIKTTLDLGLQRELEALVGKTISRLSKHGATAAAAIIVENLSAEVLAYVGSPDYHSSKNLGQNDGVFAKRQPGSALKPFVYAAAMEELGFTLATLLPDVELHLPEPGFDYSPKNYDGLYHGPVRLREALGSSFNVPAVYAASRVGPKRVLERLRQLGFQSLDKSADHYGVAIALGDGEVTLAELGQAYSALARGGRLLPLRYAADATTKTGEVVRSPSAPERRVVREETAAQLTSALSDKVARAPGFGAESVLELPFEAAVKTGTSRNFRDNWAVGYTREFTVAVWVGNFDGKPMQQSSGVFGAGPLLAEAMLLAMRGTTPARLFSGEGLVARTICPLSGKLRGPDCPHQQKEWFTPEAGLAASCDMHERLWVDAASGLLSAKECRGAVERVFERFPAEYAAWALTSGRPKAPTQVEPSCGAAVREATSGRAFRSELGIEYPFEGAHFMLDPRLAQNQQQVVFRIRAPSGAAVSLWLNGRKLATIQAPFRFPWALLPGRHRLEAKTLGGATRAVQFEVSGAQGR